MIKAAIFLERDIGLDIIVDALMGLPEIIRPVYFAEDEGRFQEINKIENEEVFLEFIKSNVTGFFLYAKNKICLDISSPSTGYISVTLHLVDNISVELARDFLRHMAKYKPVFGYACAYEEYEYRNLYFMKIGNNNIEDWVGRKLDKYISGLYWQTLISEKFLKKYDMNLSDLLVAAISSESFEGESVFLLKFFDSPSRWEESAGLLDDLCANTKGIFSKRDVDSAVYDAKSISDYDNIIVNWR